MLGLSPKGSFKGQTCTEATAAVNWVIFYKLRFLWNGAPGQQQFPSVHTLRSVNALRGRGEFEP